MFCRYLGLCSLACVCSQAIAVEAKFPINLSHEFIRQSLVNQLFRGPGQTFKAVDDGTGCHYLELVKPEVDLALPYLRVTADVEARVGKAISNRCITFFKWSGKIEIYETFSIPATGQHVKAKVKKSNLLNESGDPAKVSNQIWQWVNSYVHPKMETVVFDLSRPIQEIKYLLPLAFPSIDKSALSQIADSLRMKDVKPKLEGLRFVFLLSIPKKYTAITTPAPPLNDEEIKRLHQLLDQLDSFYTNIIRYVGYRKLETELVDELLSILLELRHEVVDILLAKTIYHKDPVPLLFLRTWEKLRPIMLELSKKQGKFQQSLQFIAFVAANEALVTLNRAGPSLGLDISARGLRRLARMIMPTLKTPLQYNQGVDRTLRDIFGFGPPLNANNPPRLNLWFDWIINPIYALAELDPVDKKLLNQYIPARHNLKEYLPIAHKILKYYASSQLEKKKLKNNYHNTYRWLMIATAWKESCWRQYIDKKGRRQPLRSSAGAVGMMQVVPRVWRGFYEPYLLKWDVAYNIEAGSEILFRYLTHYAIRKKEHEHEGGLDNLARSSYAIYNAGPRKRTRYRRPNASKRQKQVDRAFYKIFLKVKKGKDLEVRFCFG